MTIKGVRPGSGSGAEVSCAATASIGRDTFTGTGGGRVSEAIVESGIDADAFFAFSFLERFSDFGGAFAATWTVAISGVRKNENHNTAVSEIIPKNASQGGLGFIQSRGWGWRNARC